MPQMGSGQCILSPYTLGYVGPRFTEAANFQLV